MALKLYERYPQLWESPSNDYPQGAFKNLSAQGETDGSYLEKDWLNDYSGFFGALLRNAEMTPDGTIDTAQKSQFYDALVKVAKSAVDLSAYRKKDDLLFKGMLKVQATDDVAAGVFLQDTDGTVRGQVVATDQGLQLTQYPLGGGLQTFTFPSEGGEVLTDGNGKWAMPEEGGELVVKNSLQLSEATYLNKENLSRMSKLGSPLLTLVRTGLSPKNVLQAHAIDNTNKLVYSHHVTLTGSEDGSERSVINIYNLEGDGKAFKSCKGDYDLGHQGLALEHRDDGSTYLWSSRRYSNSSAGITHDFGNYVTRFSTEFENGEELQDKQFFKLFDYQGGGSSGQAATPCVSKCGRYLVARHNMGSDNKDTFIIRIFKLSDLKEGGDYSNKYTHEMYITGALGTTGNKSIQAMAYDSGVLLTLSTGMTTERLGYLHSFDLKGNVLSSDTFTVGLEDALETDSGKHYEPEGLAWYFEESTNSHYLTMLSVYGDIGNRQGTIYILGSSNKVDFESTGGRAGITLNNPTNPPAIELNATREAKATTLGKISFKGRSTSGSKDLVEGARIDAYFQSSQEGNSGVGLNFRVSNSEGDLKSTWRITANGHLIPIAPTLDLGFTSNKVKDIYLQNQPIVTSDAKAKFDIEDIDDKYMRVMSRLELRQFKMLEGTSGRTHFGIIAQEWIEACEAEGVDPKESGILVGDEKTGYAIRYNELQILFNAYILHKLKL